MTTQANLKVVNEEQAASRDLRAEIAAMQQANPKLTQAEISRQSGIHHSRLNSWLKGVYAGDNAQVEQDLARWVDAYRERQLSSRMLPAAPAWIDTPSGQRVLAALGYAQVAEDMAIIYGGAGLGKTSAIREYARTNPNVFVATMSPATATVVPCLEEIADCMGLREMSGGAGKFQRAIMKRISGTHGLLVIDEAQHLGVQALDEIRALHDATGIGVALVGNESVYARLTGGNRAAYLDRLYSRIGKRVRLLHATAADVDAIIDSWQLEVAGCKKVLHEIAAKPGGLRGLTKVLRLAAMISDGKITCEAIRTAWRDMGGEA